MRKIDFIVIHCTATPQNTTVESIKRHWHKVLGWKNPGYHIIITSTGAWSQLLDFNGVSNGVRGHNSDSIHISYIGGIDGRGRPLDTRTEEQKRVLAASYQALSMKLPGVSFHGHYEFAGKACPSFDVHEWIKSITS
jgi:N-acetylmuramoyl-L-alanine amidase